MEIEDYFIDKINSVYGVKRDKLSMSQIYADEAVNWFKEFSKQEFSMTTSDLMKLTIENNDALNNGTPRSNGMRLLSNLRNACECFSRECFSDIRKLHLSASTKGLKAKHKEIKIMSYCIAGRILVTVENNKGENFSILGGEDENDPIGGFHSISCDSTDSIFDMLEFVTKFWYDYKSKFKEDKKIQIA